MKSRGKAVAAWTVAMAALGMAGIRPVLAADDQACDEKFAFANGLLNGNPSANTPPAPAQAIQNDLNEDYTTIIQTCPTFSHLDLVYNNLAIAYLKLNQTSKAISTLETALEKFPQSAKKTDWQYTLIDSDMKLADSLLQGHPDQAKPTYQKAIQLMQTVLGQTTDPTTRVNLTFAMGNAQFNTGDYTGASRSYTSLLAMNPPAKTAALALYNKGYANLNLATAPEGADRSQALQQAASSFQDLVTRYPTDPNGQDARLQLGKVYFQEKNFSQAATAFRQLLDSPGVSQAAHTEALADLGYAYANSNQYTEAVPVFRQYVQANPGTPDTDKANVELGYILRFKTQPADLPGALAAYQAAANSKDAGTARAAQEGETAVAAAYVDNKDNARALPIYEALQTSTNPNVREDALYGRAIVLLAMKDNRAEQALTEFLQNYPSSKGTANAAYQLGVLQYGDKNYTAAAADFSRAARSVQVAADATAAQQKDAFDLRTDALYWAGNAANQAGQAAQAVQAWQQELQADPNYSSAHTADTLMALGQYYSTNHQDQDAARYYDLALTHYPNSDTTVGALLELGGRSFAQKQYDQALNYYRRLAQAQPTTEAGGSAMFDIGFTYMQMTPPQYSQAIPAFQNYLTHFPNGKLAARAAALEGEAYENQAGTGAGVNTATLQRALASYQQAVNLAPADTDPNDRELAPNAALKIAEIEGELKQTDQAMRDLDAAMAKYPTSKAVAGMAFEKGLLLKTAGQNEQALAAFQSYLQKYPNGADAPAAHFDAAAIVYNTAATERDQSFKETDPARASALLAQSKTHYAAAAADFDAAIASQSKSVPVQQAYYYQGFAYAFSDQPAKAARSFRTMLDRYPNDPNASKAEQRLGIVEATTNPTDAIQVLNRFLAGASTNPKDPDVLAANLALGEAYEASGNCANAQTAFKKVTDNTDDLSAAEATYYQAKCYEMQGDKNRARLMYQKVVLVFTAAPEWVNKAKLDLARLGPA